MISGRVWLVAMAAAFGLACSETPVSNEGWLNIEVNALTREEISRISVEITGPGMASMQSDLVKYGDLWTGVVGKIPVGVDRTVVARAYDGKGTLLYEGSAAGIQVVADKVSSVWILLQQVAAPPPFVNAPPRIVSLYASALDIVPGETAGFTVNATDANGDPLTFAWSTSEGTFAPPDGAVTQWTAPDRDGDFQISIRVSDPAGATAEASFWVHVRAANATGRIQINAELNTWPVVTNVDVSPSRVQPNETATVTVSAGDPDGDALQYLWTADCAGVFGGATAITTFTPTEQPAAGECTLSVEASDGRGGTARGSIVLYVAAPVAVDSAPVITKTFQSLLAAAAGTQVVLRAEAMDPEGGPVKIQWKLKDGKLVSQVDGVGSSEIVWIVPACGAAEASVIVTDETGLSTSYTFAVDTCQLIRVGVMAGGWYTDELRAYLDADPRIVATNVTACDLATLQKFDVVWLYGNMPCFDAAAFDAYASAGGGIVATPWIIANYGGFGALPVTGDRTHVTYHGPLDVTVTDPTDPLLAGVVFVPGDDVGHESATTVKPGATESVAWNVGPNPAVVSWSFGAGRVAYLDFHYITSDCGRAITYGWGQRLAVNAVYWANGP